MVDNRAADSGLDCGKLGADWAACNKVLIGLTNDNQDIKGQDWAIHFTVPARL